MLPESVLHVLRNVLEKKGGGKRLENSINHNHLRNSSYDCAFDNPVPRPHQVFVRFIVFLPSHPLIADGVTYTSCVFV